MNKEKDKKIKVVIGINDFTVGGAQRLIANQFKFFNKDKFDIQLVILNDIKGRKDLFHELPNDVYLTKFRFGRIFNLKEWFRLYFFLKKEKPDVVLSHLFFSNTIFRILKIFLGYKIVIVEHNTYVGKKWHEILIDRLLSFMTSYIIAVSKTVAGFTSKQENISPDKFVVIHNGIDLSLISDFLKKEVCNKEDIKTKLGFSLDDKVILSVGRLQTQKNHKALIMGFAKFCIKNLNYKLVILGDGPLEEGLRGLVTNLGLDDKVLLLGARKDVFSFYLISEFLISTSIIEGLSMAYLEALSFGLPILSTKTAGTDEIIKDGYNGFFLRGSDEDTVVSGIVKMINSEKEVLSKNAKESALNFSIQSNVSKYEENLVNLAGYEKPF